jgi:hypothetical protein
MYLPGLQREASHVDGKYGKNMMDMSLIASLKKRENRRYMMKMMKLLLIAVIPAQCSSVPCTCGSWTLDFQHMVRAGDLNDAFRRTETLIISVPSCWE